MGVTPVEAEEEEEARAVWGATDTCVSGVEVGGVTGSGVEVGGVTECEVPPLSAVGVWGGEAVGVCECEARLGTSRVKNEEEWEVKSEGVKGEWVRGEGVRGEGDV